MSYLTLKGAVIKNMTDDDFLGFCLENHDLGIERNSSAGFTLRDRSVFSPDASWVSKEKWKPPLGRR